jgi:hypothetical protein
MKTIEAKIIDAKIMDAKLTARILESDQAIGLPPLRKAQGRDVRRA